MSGGWQKFNSCTNTAAWTFLLMFCGIPRLQGEDRPLGLLLIGVALLIVRSHPRRGQ